MVATAGQAALNPIDTVVERLHDGSEQQPCATSALKFVTTGDFERGIDILLDQGAATALPHLVFIANTQSIRRAVRTLRAAGVECEIRSDVPPVLTEEDARTLATKEGWERIGSFSARSSSAIPRAGSLATKAVRKAR